MGGPSLIRNQNRTIARNLLASAAMVLALAFSSCSKKPEPDRLPENHCKSSYTEISNAVKSVTDPQMSTIKAKIKKGEIYVGVDVDKDGKASLRGIRISHDPFLKIERGFLMKDVTGALSKLELGPQQKECTIQVPIYIQ
jgi:hypothetical protein